MIEVLIIAIVSMIITGVASGIVMYNIGYKKCYRDFVIQLQKQKSQGILQ